MSRTVRVVFVLLLGLALSGCTARATTTASTPRSSGVVVAGEAGSDVGNGRPKVTYDGLMVRRRVVIAVHPTAGADLVVLRKELDDAATRLHTTLTTISPDVLDQALLEHLAPEVTVALPADQTRADAGRLIDPATPGGRRFPQVQRYNVASVLVHDLRFTARSARPDILATAISREGILSDALGNYTTILGDHELDITYTGPLLSDDLVEAVRAGIARRADIQPVAVTVSPRSSTGVGVDMAKEPAPAPAAVEVPTTHHHGSTADSSPALSALPAEATTSTPHSSLWMVSVVALPLLLILTLVLLLMRRGDRPKKS